MVGKEYELVKGDLVGEVKERNATHEKRRRVQIPVRVQIRTHYK